MDNWKRTDEEMPDIGQRVVICFWWPDGRDFNMTIGIWPYAFSDAEWGCGCLALYWMPAPDYPENLPNNG